MLLKTNINREFNFILGERTLTSANITKREIIRSDVKIRESYGEFSQLQDVLGGTGVHNETRVKQEIRGFDRCAFLIQTVPCDLHTFGNSASMC